MASLFTKIINGEIPAQRVMEDDNYLAFLDIRPINPGHCLAITKKEIDYVFDVDDELLSGLMVFAKKVALKIDKVTDCKRVGVMIAGLEVPHCHVHLVPMNDIGDLNFANAKDTDQEALAAMAERIRNA